MKALALDFDGVVSKSAREAFAVALRSFAELRPDARLPQEAAGDSRLYEAFVELMPLGNRAEDYGVALTALEAGAELGDQAAYDAFYASCDVSWLRRFHRRFYEVRGEWARRDPEGWMAQMEPYGPLLDLLRRRAGEVVYAIATAKDRASVCRLLGAYGVGDLFDPRWILDKETGVSKRAHLERLAAGLGAALPEITFVDDKLNHLESVAPLGVRCVLAAWGYNGPREQEAARGKGFAVATLEDAEPVLFRTTRSPPGALR
jgi:phosphoglycolate phosphatase-like HAD superfamily hydrolase